MTFAIDHSTTALHILQAPHGTGITTRRRQGEVLVSDGVRTQPFYFDKITYAPFQEALYSAVGHTALAQRSTTAEVHCSTWIVGNTAEDAVIDVCKVFATNTVKALLAKPVGAVDASLSQSAPAVVECCARCVYPWGSLDLVRNEELRGDAGADWSCYGRSTVYDVASFNVVLHAVLRFTRDTKSSSKKHCPVIQLAFFVKHSPLVGPRGNASSPATTSSYTITISPHVADVCRAFAVDARALQDTLLRVRKGRWLGNPLLRFLVSPSVSVLDAFTLITCVGGGEELMSCGKKPAPNASILSACKFAGRDSSVNAAAEDTALSITPSSLSLQRKNQSAAHEASRANASEGDTTQAALAGLFTGYDRRVSERSPSGPLVNAPPTQPPETLPSMWRESPLTYFGRFAAPPDGDAAQPVLSADRATEGTHRGGTLMNSPSRSMQGPVSEAVARVEGELAAHVREKERRAEEAVRAAEQRMAQARQTELAARELARNLESEGARLRTRHDDEMNQLRNEHERLQRRGEETNTELTQLMARVLEARGEADGLEVQLCTAQQALQQTLRAAEEAAERARAADALQRRTREQEAHLAGSYMQYLQQTSLLLSRAVALHQEVFDAAASGVHRALQRRVQDQKTALVDVTERLDIATTQLLDIQERTSRCRADCESVQSQAKAELSSVNAQVAHLRGTERVQRETVAALQRQIDALREQLSATAKGMSDQCVGVVVNMEVLERQHLCAEWEEARSTQLSQLTVALQHTAGIERVMSCEAQQRAHLEAEAFVESAGLFSRAVAKMPPAARSASALAASAADLAGAPSVVRAELTALRQENAQLAAETSAALTEVRELAAIKETLEREIVFILQDLDSAVGEVADAETAMLRESERSLKILQLSEAESASQYSALIDRCTALIEARSTSRRNSVPSSLYGGD